MKLRQIRRQENLVTVFERDFAPGPHGQRVFEGVAFDVKEGIRSKMLGNANRT